MGEGGDTSFTFQLFPQGNENKAGLLKGPNSFPPRVPSFLPLTIFCVTEVSHNIVKALVKIQLRLGWQANRMPDHKAN